jgi:hypothetical protein
LKADASQEFQGKHNHEVTSKTPFILWTTPALPKPITQVLSYKKTNAGVIFTYYSQQHKGKLHVQQFVSEPSTQEDYIVTVLPKNMYQLYTFLLHLRKKESIGICLPSLEDFSFFFCVGVVELGLSANLLTGCKIM